MKRRSFLSAFLSGAAALLPRRARAGFAIFQVNGPSLIPAGVTFQAIDGGATYFASNGFTKASSYPTNLSWNGNTTPLSGGWDDPKFFMISIYEGQLNVSGDGTTYNGLSVNTMNWADPANNVSGQANYVSIAQTHNISLLPLLQPNQAAANKLDPAQWGSETVGMLPMDEADSFNEAIQQVIGGLAAVVFSGNITSNRLNCLSPPSSGGNNITVGALASGALPAGAVLTGTGVTANQMVNAIANGTGQGGVGDYQILLGQANTSTPITITQSAFTALANTYQDTRFIHNNFSSKILGPNLPQASPGGTAQGLLSAPVATPSGTGIWINRHIDITGCDIYWMSGVRASNTADNIQTTMFGLGAAFYNSGLTAPPFTGGAATTFDQTCRASHYGDIVDMFRGLQASNFPAPVFLPVEVGGPDGGNTSAGSYITQQEMNWAIWSQIIHGVRGIVYFDLTAAGPAAGTPNSLTSTYFNTAANFTATLSSGSISGTTLTATTFSSNAGYLAPGMVVGGTATGGAVILQQKSGSGWTLPATVGPPFGDVGTYLITSGGAGSGAGITCTQPNIVVLGTTAFTGPLAGTIGNQAKATNATITDLARVINAPFAKSFISSVSPSGYIFAASANPGGFSNVLDPGGIDCMAKYYTGGTFTLLTTGDVLTNGFYIFATTRLSETAVNTSATFTLAAGYGSSVTVVGESRSISIFAGQFTDTFAFAWTVHIYKVNP